MYQPFADQPPQIGLRGLYLVKETTENYKNACPVYHSPVHICSYSSSPVHLVRRLQTLLTRLRGHDLARPQACAAGVRIQQRDDCSEGPQAAIRSARVRAARHTATPAPCCLLAPPPPPPRLARVLSTTVPRASDSRNLPCPITDKLAPSRCCLLALDSNHTPFRSQPHRPPPPLRLLSPVVESNSAVVSSPSLSLSRHSASPHHGVASKARGEARRARRLAPQEGHAGPGGPEGEVSRRTETQQPE